MENRWIDRITAYRSSEAEAITKASTRFLLPRTSCPAFHKTITRHIKDKRTPFKETEQASEPDSDMAGVKTRKGKKKKKKERKKKWNTKPEKEIKHRKE